MSENLTENSLESEQYREYEFGPEGSRTTYRIDNPATLVMRTGGTTHRVVDSVGVVHCLPAPGEKGCVLRWKNRDTFDPVEF